MGKAVEMDVPRSLTETGMSRGKVSIVELVTLGKCISVLPGFERQVILQYLEGNV